ncbi:uncharacterized protein LOC134650081 isoform X1 [Cydia amplana]|uniref:uncharacterized protein LOC134650081 isoform X1 n=1 Tax=Cydia amplana TaxID=1869771 RepID=UPI002FE5317D
MNDKNVSPPNNSVSTPPSYKKVRNPFDRVLIDKLHKPICSPSMCKIYKKERRGSFRWDIDQACTLQPTDIVACSSQFEPSPDPNLDQIAEEATEIFFSQEMVMPSPMESSKKKPLLMAPAKSEKLIESFKDSTVVMKDVSAQTTLSLPPELPPELEKMLAPYFTFDQGQDVFGEYEITANGSLRRKLYFEHSDTEHHSECDSEQTDDEHHDTRPPSSFEAHVPVTYSPDLKNNFTSPESEAMATCLDCIASDSDPDSGKKRQCYCKSTPNISLKRSASLKDSPPRRKHSFTFAGKRSLSLSSLHRSRSVQKLDFSMNMSVDGSLHDHSQADCETSLSPDGRDSWSLVGDTNVHLEKESHKEHSNTKRPTKKYCMETMDNTPIKGKTENSGRHEISKIRAPLSMTPMDMSLDNSLDTSDNALSMEDKKIDFNNIDLKFLTENITKFDYTATDATKNATDASSSFKKLDSGINENTFYTNASSYYESAIKPSELTITNTNSSALKEISNVHWARVDSGFKDETSSDNTQFYTEKSKGFRFTEAKLEEKENVMTGNFSGFLNQPSNKGEVMSMSDLFPDDMTFTCNFSSTPSKSKPNTLNS